MKVVEAKPTTGSNAKARLVDVRWPTEAHTAELLDTRHAGAAHLRVDEAEAVVSAGAELGEGQLLIPRAVAMHVAGPRGMERLLMDLALNLIARILILIGY